GVVVTVAVRVRVAVPARGQDLPGDRRPAEREARDRGDRDGDVAVRGADPALTAGVAGLGKLSDRMGASNFEKSSVFLAGWGAFYTWYFTKGPGQTHAP